MQNAFEDACAEAGSRDLVVSGDGSWQKRGFSSHHGIAAIISSSDVPKVTVASFNKANYKMQISVRY